MANLIFAAWKVKSAEGKNIGKVKELLFDTASLRVRYVIVSLDGKPLNLLSREIIIPVGLAELNMEDKYVLFPQVTVAHYASLPEYKKGEVAVNTEREIRSVFAPTKAVVYKDPDFNDPDFYNNEYFDEERMYRPRHQVDRTQIVKETAPAIKEVKEDRKARFIPVRNDRKESLADDEVFYRKVGPNHFEPVDNKLIANRFAAPAFSNKENDIVVDEEMRDRRSIIRDTGRTNEVDLNNLDVDDLPED